MKTLTLLRDRPWLIAGDTDGVFISGLKQPFYDGRNYLLLSPEIDYGRNRREAIKKAFQDHPNLYLAVDRKGCPQVRSDPDLKQLVKRGFLKKVKLVSHTVTHAYLVRGPVNVLQ